MADRNNPNIPDPYETPPDTALDILERIQTALWYEKDGVTPRKDQDWTSETLERIVEAMAPLAPRTESWTASPKRLTTVQLTILTPASAVAPLTQREIGEILINSRMHEVQQLPPNREYALGMSQRTELLSPEAASNLLKGLGYLVDHFERED